MLCKLRHSFLPLLLACVFALVCTPLAGKERPAENVALLDSLASLFSASLARNPNDPTLPSLSFSEHPAAERLRRLFPEHPAANGAPGLAAATMPAPYYIADYSIRYFLHEDDSDSLVREATLWVYPGRAVLPNSAANFNTKLRDTIARADLPFVESSQFSFGRAPVPEQPSSFYSDVAEPLIVVSTAVITILLLFTVRSQ